jgi:predicted ATPase/DNA-binding winged helix-turn-helix (wHTH) protein
LRRMDPVSDPPAGIAFGRFRVVPHRRELIADGLPIKVGSRAFDVLMALIEARGAIVGKAALMARVWPDRVVEENNLQAQIVVLRKAFGTERELIRTVPGRGYQFTGEIRILSASPEKAGSGVATAEPASILPPTNIPEPVSELIGRDEELAEVLNLVGAHRLVTLTGVGGIGKTRLALALARELRQHFTDGVWLAEFSALTDPGLVPATVAAAVGLELDRGGDVSARRVAEALAGRHMLLFLDTCEHLIDAMAAMAEAMLQAGGAPRIIATSREPLRTEGEWIFQVPPLSVPAAEDCDPYQYGAVLLFLVRSRASGALVSEDRHVAPAIAAICRQLDGIPLAIELAAARAVALGIDGLATRLNDRFQLLTGGRRTALPRHQTLRATLDWSYGLLTGDERLFFRRLAIFAGSFTLEAASNLVSAPGSDAVERLADLVAKSLVTAEVSGSEPRFRLLDTTRAYALQKLRESGELDELGRRHAEYYRAVFDRAETEWETRSATEWLADYSCEIHNLRAALDWAFSPGGEVSIGAALAGSAVPLWMHLSLLDECASWMMTTLDAFPPERLGTRLEMVVQLAFGYSTMVTRGLSDKARAALERANQLGKALGDLDYQLRALTNLVVFSRMLADFSPAVGLSRQLDAVAQEIGTPLALATADCLLASTLLWVGQYVEARTRAEAGSRRDDAELRRAHRIRHGYDHWMNSRTLLAQILWLQGFSEQSLQLVREVLIEAQQMSHPFTLAYALTTTGCLVPLWTGHFQVAEQGITRLKKHAESHALESYYAAGLGFEGLLFAARGDGAAGVRLVRASLAELSKTGFYLYYTVLLSGLAEILASSGEFDEATAAASEAAVRADRGNNGWWLPEALRVKGEVLLATTPGGTAQAEDLFGQALDLAHRQGALSWELRAATGLALLLRDQARPADAVAILQPVYDRFTEGFDTTDLKRAKALLDDLE